ncbi:hypothetical protein HW555_014186 [Spodoptera exigua]|uniref:PiggyBac transposable element-derived protein domain-containing protein n=1 Tax=Spodoptera exigua TaxID=7107 RepID=A0A835G059_SPOEX|nr:hypothetical protein HW555_014186 [Spodoptera exigua]
MAAKQQAVRVTRNLKLTRSHKILALVPEKNACSEGSSSSDEETNVYIPPSPDTSDPPSLASSLEGLNLLDSSTESNKEQIDISVDAPLTPIFNEVFPSPTTSNYNILPTLNSIQSLPTPTVEQSSPQPGTSRQQLPLTRSKHRYFKIRPVMERIRQNFLKVEEEGKYSIDEMMIPYKGRKAGKRKQYVKMKPKKWGFKNFVRAGVSGIIYDFLLYGGDDTFRGLTFRDKEASIGLGGKVVIALCQTIRQKPAIIYADNFFMSLELTHILREEYGILSLGTIRTNRLRGCQELLPTDQQMKKKKRGSSAQVVCNKNKLAVVKWNDNKVVTLISSYIDSHPIETIKRYDKDEKKKVHVECPQIVKHYNKHMGGVDLADMLISLYRTPFKSHRWYLGIFSQLIDMCINNAWLLHKRDGKNIMLKDFRFQLFEGLTKSNKIVKGINATEDIGEDLKIHKPVSVRPTDSVRFDDKGHLPEAGDETMRCKYCKSGRTTIWHVFIDFDYMA